MGNSVTIFEEIGPIFNLKKQEGTFGIEIETSAKEPYDVPSVSGWKVHEDPSIRDFGREYVLKSPQAFGQIPVFLKKFKDGTKDIKFQPHASTSVHVHINMAAETFLTFANFVVIYSMFEPLLMKFCGELRSNSLFAVSFRKAEMLTPFFCRLFSGVSVGDVSPIRLLHKNEHKYACLNVYPLNVYGSVEIRCLEGTTDTERIMLWVDILNSLLIKSRQDGLTPTKIIQKYLKNPEEFVVDLFFKNVKVLLFGGWKEEVERNLWYVYQIARSVPDWEALNGVVYTAMKDSVKYKDPLKLKKQVDPMGWHVYNDFGGAQPNGLIIDEAVNF